MPAIVPKLVLVKTDEGILISNHSTYGDLARHTVAVNYIFYKINNKGIRSIVAGPFYDPYYDDNLTFEPEEPGYYEIVLHITDDCTDSGQILYYPESMIEDDKKAFLDCKCVGCMCYKCRAKEIKSINNYVILKVLFDQVKILEAAGEMFLASCLLTNIKKLIEGRKSCSAC